jgi:multidrug resistance efflux pump
MREDPAYRAEFERLQQSADAQTLALEAKIAELERLQTALIDLLAALRDSDSRARSELEACQIELAFWKSEVARYRELVRTLTIGKVPPPTRVQIDAREELEADERRLRDKGTK